MTGDTKMMALLLDHGADLNGVGSQSRGPRPKTPLIAAVEGEQPDAVAFILSRRPNLSVHDQGNQALQLALTRAGQPPEFVRGLPRRPLTLPSVYLARQDRILNMLLNAGVDVRSEHSAVLCCAIQAEQPDLVKLLLAKGADPNARDSEGQSALSNAIIVGGGDEGMASMIRSGQAFTTNPVSDYDAGRNRSGSIFDMLISKGADVNSADRGGLTPLIWCVGNNSLREARILLSKGAKLEARDLLGRTALIHCAMESDTKLASLLLKRGAKIEKHDDEGYTALMLAICEPRELKEPRYYAGGNRVLPSETSEKVRMVQFLLSHGADPWLTAKDGTTAVGLAESARFSQIPRILAGARG
jgi:ankyrin repeat protein